MVDFSKINMGVSGDSITAWKQWSWTAFEELGMATHTNVAVGSSVWYKRTITTEAGSVTTQNPADSDFAGVSGGWEPTEDLVELQMRANNCAIVHIQQYLQMVKAGEAPVPELFTFSYGTNDDGASLGDPELAVQGKDKDAENVDLFTEAGAVRWCIQTIQENFPDCKIFVLTPIQTGSPEHNAKNRKTIEVIKAIANEMSVQVIDMYGKCGICEKYEVEGGTGRYLRDGLHPDEPGQQLMGRYVASVLRRKMF